MKTKNLSTMFIRAMVGLLFTSGLLLTGTAMADDDAKVECESVQVTAPMLVSASPVGPITGIVDFVVDGVPASSVVVITLLGPPQVNPDGTQNLLARLHYIFESGDELTGLGQVLLIPTSTPGAFSTRQQAFYTGGTGVYDGVFGKVNASGQMSFVELTASISGAGAMCHFKASDSDDDSDSNG